MFFWKALQIWRNLSIKKNRLYVNAKGGNLRVILEAIKLPIIYRISYKHWICCLILGLLTENKASLKSTLAGLRGHSTTTWTEFAPPPLNGPFLYYNIPLVWTKTDMFWPPSPPPHLVHVVIEWTLMHYAQSASSFTDGGKKNEMDGSFFSVSF